MDTIDKDFVLKTMKIKFYCDDLGVTLTIKQYLKELLIALWDEKESFSGKRPFGNSGWELDLYKVLVEEKIIKGRINEEDSYLESCNKKEGDRIILLMIKSL